MTRFLLNLRAMLGWWRHPVELRAMSAHYLRMLRDLAAFSIVWIPVVAVFFSSLFRHRFSLLPTPQSLRFAGVMIGMYFIYFGVFTLW